MKILKILSKKQQRKRSNLVQKDYLDRLGAEQIKKMVELGARIPVISL